MLHNSSPFRRIGIAFAVAFVVSLPANPGATTLASSAGHSATFIRVVYALVIACAVAGIAAWFGMLFNWLSLLSSKKVRSSVRAATGLNSLDAFSDNKLEEDALLAKTRLKKYAVLFFLGMVGTAGVVAAVAFA